MLDSFYHMALKLFCNRIFGVKTLNERHCVTLLKFKYIDFIAWR